MAEVSRRVRCRGFAKVTCVVAFAVSTLFWLPGYLQAQDAASSQSDTNGHAGGVGFSASAEATSKDVGLPIYPGAKPHKDKGDDSSAVQLEMWGKLAGFKVVVLKYESDDNPAKLVAFYQNALTKYGKVLNCSDPQPAKAVKKDDDDSLECESDKPKNGTVELKAGTKDEQHLVGVEPNGSGSLLHLVYVDSREMKSSK
jgi:hypothetical protein